MIELVVFLITETVGHSAGQSDHGEVDAGARFFRSIVTRAIVTEFDVTIVL